MELVVLDLLRVLLSVVKILLFVFVFVWLVCVHACACDCVCVCEINCHYLVFRDCKNTIFNLCSKNVHLNCKNENLSTFLITMNWGLVALDMTKTTNNWLMADKFINGLTKLFDIFGVSLPSIMATHSKQSLQLVETISKSCSTSWFFFFFHYALIIVYILLTPETRKKTQDMLICKWKLDNERFTPT